MKAWAIKPKHLLRTSICALLASNKSLAFAQPSAGNPELKPVRAGNLDLAVEFSRAPTCLARGAARMTVWKRDLRATGSTTRKSALL